MLLYYIKLLVHCCVYTSPSLSTWGITSPLVFWYIMFYRFSTGYIYAWCRSVVLIKQVLLRPVKIKWHPVYSGYIPTINVQQNEIHGRNVTSFSQAIISGHSLNLHLGHTKAAWVSYIVKNIKTFSRAWNLCKFYANQYGYCLHVGCSVSAYWTWPKSLTIQLRPGGCGCYYGNSQQGCVRAWCLLGCSSQNSRALHRARRPQGFCGTPPLSLQNKDY